MNVLEMSKLIHAFPMIQTTGLAAWWKLLRNENLTHGRPPTIQMQEALNNLETTLVNNLVHPKSAAFMRDRYQHVVRLLKQEPMSVDDA